MNWRISAALACVVTIGLDMAPAVRACPFCSVVSQTLCEKIDTSDVAVLAELIESPPAASDAVTPVSNEAIEAAKSTFRVLRVYRGAQLIRQGDTFKAMYYGKTDPGVKCLAIALEPKDLQWGLPTELSPRAVAYVEQAVKLPASGPDRLTFFEDYLEAPEQILQEDAMGEFARSDYGALRQMRGRLNHDRLLRWIQDPAVTEPRRRLYFTLLGICGNAKDAPVLEKMIRSGDPAQLLGLDALLACYVTLDGPKGLPLVEELFLKRKDADFPQIYPAVMAVRFLGEQGDIVPRSRAIEAMRLMLDRPELADLVMPDLARWEDWDSIDRMVTIFKEATKERRYVRESVVNYLRACPRPEAKARLDELSKLDPQSVRNAMLSFPRSYSPPAAKSPGKSKGQRQKASKQGAPAAAKVPAATSPAAASPATAPKAGSSENPTLATPPTDPQTGGSTKAGNGAAPGGRNPQAGKLASDAARADKPAESAAPPMRGRSDRQLAAPPPAPVSSGRHRWLTTLVLAGPPAGAAVLILLLWLILRPSYRNRLDQTS